MCKSNVPYHFHCMSSFLVSLRYCTSAFLLFFSLSHCCLWHAVCFQWLDCFCHLQDYLRNHRLSQGRRRSFTVSFIFLTSQTSTSSLLFCFVTPPWLCTWSVWYTRGGLFVCLFCAVIVKALLLLWFSNSCFAFFLKYHFKVYSWWYMVLAQ